MKMLVISMALALAVGLGGGCGSSPSKVEDGDRQVVHQTVGASALLRGHMALAIAALTGDPVKITEATNAVRDAALVALDIEENAQQLAKNFGPPKDPKDYSVEASKEARDQSAKEHSGVGFWGWIVGAAGVALAGLKVVASYVPSIARFFSGPYGAVAETAVEWIAGLRQNGKVDAADLAYLKKLQEDARIQPFVKELAKKAEAELKPSTPTT